MAADDAPAALAAALRAAPARAGTTRVIAIDGPSGAGKTTLAEAVAEALGGAPVVHMDDLYPGWTGLDAAVPRLVGWVLEPLAAGTAAGYRRWDWAAHRYGERVPVPAVPELVVEGVGCGARAAAPYLSLLVWLDAPPDLRHARRTARDGEPAEPWWELWTAQETAHFAREGTAARADKSLDATR